MKGDDTHKGFQFELKPYNRGITNEELVADLQQVAKKLEKDTVTQKEYSDNGLCSHKIFHKRFGSWNSALHEAGLKTSVQKDISNKQLFENLEMMWRALGRQPNYLDMQSPPSKYHVCTYDRRFGGWRKALEAFVEFINSQDDEENELSAPITEPSKTKRRTNREPSLRLRFLVMRRDQFKCRYCGKSPATHAGVELHLDHILAWAKSGETVFDNLQTLCSNCNFGKSDLSAIENNQDED